MSLKTNDFNPVLYGRRETIRKFVNDAVSYFSQSGYVPTLEQIEDYVTADRWAKANISDGIIGYAKHGFEYISIDDLCTNIQNLCSFNLDDIYESKNSTFKKLRIKEAVYQTLYCVAGFDESENQSYNGGNLVLVAFKSLGDAEDFEEMIVQHVKDAEKQSSYDYDYEDYEDYLDPEYFDVTLGYLDDDADVLYDLNCAGVYTVDIREALNAVDHDNSIIPGFEVVILNQKDIDAHKIIWFENIPDKYYK